MRRKDCVRRDPFVSEKPVQGLQFGLAAEGVRKALSGLLREQPRNAVKPPRQPRISQIGLSKFSLRELSPVNLLLFCHLTMRSPNGSPGIKNLCGIFRPPLTPCPGV